MSILTTGFSQRCRPTATSHKRNKMILGGKSEGQDVERAMLNGRYFYHFANYSNNWTLFVFDSYYKQTFRMYNASELKHQFYSFFFHYVPYDINYGLVYNDDKVVKICFDHEARRLHIVGEPFVLTRVNEFRMVFEIHTVEIMPNDIVFIYTCRDNTNVSQRLYLQHWSNLTEQFKMCKIGIRDGLDPVQFVSGQFVDKNRLCIVHMQDKNRPYGLIIPLILLWDTEGEVAPEKFEKIECEDGQPFFKKLNVRVLDDKKYTGAWHNHMFSLLISRFMARSKRHSTYLFVFDGLAKVWTPIVLPKIARPVRTALLGFSNAGHDENPPLIFYSKNNKLPGSLYRMPVRIPEKLDRLCQLQVARCGLVDAHEQSVLMDLEMKRETDLRAEHQRLAKEYQKKARDQLVKIKELKKKHTTLKKRDYTGKLLPPLLFNEF